MDQDFFSDNAVPMDLLRRRAFNMRWAQQPADVIPLTAADPDFPACPAVREALPRYVSDGVLGYVPAEGLPDFREAVPEWLSSTRRVECGTADGSAAYSPPAATPVLPPPSP